MDLDSTEVRDRSKGMTTREGASRCSPWTSEGDDSSQQKIGREGVCRCCCSDDRRQKKDAIDEPQCSCCRTRESNDCCQRNQEKKKFDVEVIGMEAETTSKYGNKRKCSLQKLME